MRFSTSVWSTKAAAWVTGSMLGIVFFINAAIWRKTTMEFFNQAITVLQTLVVAIGAGLGVWGVVNLMEAGSYQPFHSGLRNHDGNFSGIQCRVRFFHGKV